MKTLEISIDAKDIQKIVSINLNKIGGISKSFEKWLDNEESREFREEACEDSGETLIIFINSAELFLKESYCEHRIALEKLVEVCNYYKINQIIKFR